MTFAQKSINESRLTFQSVPKGLRNFQYSVAHHIYQQHTWKKKQRDHQKPTKTLLACERRHSRYGVMQCTLDSRFFVLPKNKHSTACMAMIQPIEKSKASIFLKLYPNI